MPLFLRMTPRCFLLARCTLTAVCGSVAPLLLALIGQAVWADEPLRPIGRDASQSPVDPFADRGIDRKSVV